MTPSHFTTLLAESVHGSLRACDCCNQLHLTFGMLHWHFEVETFERFCEFVVALDPASLVEIPRANAPVRRLAFSLPPTNLSVALTQVELLALRDLLLEGQRARLKREQAALETLFHDIEAWLSPPAP